MVRLIDPATEARLLRARLHRFGEPVTAYLTDVRICAGCALGVVYWDVQRRFFNGRLIRTSDIHRVVQSGRYWLLATESRSQYVVVSFQRPGGRKSLEAYLPLLCRGIFPTPLALQ
ncbi:hypothetical protein D0N87_18355 [Pseudomonas sp. ATCC 13867]|nr:hypothetical protein D0N87_18355 [Pseudomonas sp. ATCC 13867]